MFFDGCAVNLYGRSGLRIKKPWKVITNMVELEPLSQNRCSGDHVHGSRRGVDAEETSLYTDDLVEKIGHCVTGGNNKCMLAPVRKREEEGSEEGEEQQYSRRQRIGGKNKDKNRRSCHHFHLRDKLQSQQQQQQQQQVRRLKKKKN